MSYNNVIEKLLNVSDTCTNNILNRDEIVKFITEVRNILFLGYNEKINSDVKLYIEDKIILINDLLKEILLKLNVRSDLATKITREFINYIPEIKEKLNKDIEAFLSSDPAVTSEHEIILCYPGFYAISLYRIASYLKKIGVVSIPRIICEHAHSKTGIDIHPGATIGENFFIDHGTGVVIGETSIIGNNVKIYQGVTLGAISLSNALELKNVKRHPTIEDNVIIYSNTSILGGQTIIGEGSIIGCNVFITKSIEKFSKVVFNVDNKQKIK